MNSNYDLVIVGTGIAGLYGALCSAAEVRVLIVSKGPVLTSSSWLAQGGVAAAVAEDDSAELHFADTLRAARVRDLVDFGVRFDEELGLEGGHSRRRVHSVGGAASGREISRTLARAVLR